MARFADRSDAGRLLARGLEHLRGPETVVVGLPRGGVPVAAEVARELGAPLDVMIVRKLGAPSNPEFAIGAVGEDGAIVVHEDAAAAVSVGSEALEQIVASARSELDLLAQRLRGGRPPHPLTGKTAIVVDDGIATGATAEAAIRVARKRGAARVVVAVPVAPPQSVALLRCEADEVVALAQPRELTAVGLYYDDFRPVSTERIAELLDGAGR